MYKHYIGFDNGVSGSIGVVGQDGSFCSFIPTPVVECKNYTKENKNVNRVDVEKLKIFLMDYTGLGRESMVFIERPMVNPARFNATLSAIRALEATLIVLESVGLPYQYLDSKEWQRAMLPQGIWKQNVSVTGRKTMKADPKDLKKASKEVTKRLYPQVEVKDDGDGILIAEYGRQKQLGILK